MDNKEHAVNTTETNSDLESKQWILEEDQKQLSEAVAEQIMPQSETKAPSNAQKKRVKRSVQSKRRKASSAGFNENTNRGAIGAAVRKSHLKKGRRAVAIVICGIAVAIAATAGIAVAMYRNSDSNVLRSSQELKVDVPGVWYSLPTYGIDGMIPTDMEECTPDELSDFMIVSKEIGYDDEICAEAGFITVPDISEGDFDPHENGEEMWDKLNPALSRVIQQTFNAVSAGTTYELSYEEDQEFGKYFFVSAEYVLQQFVENKETGEPEPREDEVYLRVKAAVRNINGRPVLAWAGYRPGYDVNEEAKRDERYLTVFQSLIATSDVTGKDLGYTYEDVGTLITTDKGDPLRIAAEKETADDSVGTNDSPSSTEVEKVLALGGWFLQDDGSYEYYSSVDPEDLEDMTDEERASLVTNGAKLDAEQALELYRQLKDNYDDTELETAYMLIEEYKQVKHSDSESIGE